ncbi:DNA topoisomerase IB [Tropicimonas sp. IMCC34011]|uniref:DNA topoisomerase IB n=1 Tax=Tropicimonas sp. IMCC34011 TaxID=2248759 RepID=UPI000E278D4B|nr:DNA topoisomerase IB [Tropicimonas sp. IMCC34011]
MPQQGLVYYPDSRPGIRREKRGTGFSYIAPDGTRIRDAKKRKEIASLAVPPAYVDVWICPLPNGHLQATGTDARSRKQYRYHPDWTEFRAQRKFSNLAAFGEHLPSLRRWISNALKADAGDPELAIGATLALIDRTSIRVGHPDYTSQNKSYGATTLRRRHVEFDGGKIALNYTAKGGQEVETQIHGPALARALHRIDDLPGAELIGWTDRHGEWHAVRSEQLSDRLAETCGPGATCKTFRTWNGTLAAWRHALSCGAERLTISGMAKAASEALHNTPTIARNSYIHPEVIALAEMDGEARAALLARHDVPSTGEYRAGEEALLSFLAA